MPGSKSYREEHCESNHPQGHRCKKEARQAARWEMTAELTVVGWFVSPVLKSMVDKARSYISRQYHWRRDVEDELGRLETALTQIQAVVAVAERRSIRDESQAALLRKLKDAVYEADDVLDEFEYQLLRARAESQRTVRRVVSSSMQLGRRVTGRDKLRQKLGEVLAKVDSINATAERFLQVVGMGESSAIGQPDPVAARVTSSFITEPQVFGREEEREEMIGLLLHTGDEEAAPRDGSVAAVCIVGVGGVGKTTLAQLVYNDKRAVSHFNLRMWVCVADKFDVIKLTRDILLSSPDPESKEKHGDNWPLDLLQLSLQSRLSSKRFLLVLDDVWNEEGLPEWQNKERWRKLFAPLKFGERGSVILVTTRMELVARMLDATELFPLEGLTSGACWSLLTKCAFGDKNPDDHPDFKMIAEQIAERLKGSPLAAKVIGGLLNAKFDIESWKRILRNNIWYDIMPVLRLSYQHLPDHLQRCFAYCSIFPRDWSFDPESLVQMWMAQGFIQAQDRVGKSLEDVGREYFDDLLARSFFQMLKRGELTYYFMHHLMHDLAESVSMDECFRIDGDTSRTIPQTIRHLSVATDYLPQLTSLCQLKTLRTLIFFIDDFSQVNVFKELKSIRVLDLNGCLPETFPKDISHFIHLRYLNLSGTLLMLPESLCRLYHLQVLNASRQYRIDCFPKRISNLISMRHLNMHAENIPMISGIGKLTCLQGLLEFHVVKRKGCRIRELKDLKELRGLLHIKNLENLNKMEEAIEAKLNEKEHIRMLRLVWSSSGRANKHDMDVRVLEGLQPHQNLRDLSISGFRGSRSPGWLNIDWLYNLESIYLTNCRFWVALPPLGQLPLLKILHIKGMSAVKQVGPEFYGSSEVKDFPSLEDLRFHDMPEWTVWSGIEGGQLFPRLRKLNILGCPKLTGLPPVPSTLMSMDINHIESIPYARLYPSLSSSSSATYFTLETSGAITVCGEAFLHRHHLKSIDELQISHSEELLSAEGFRELISLKKLKMLECPKLLASMGPEDEQDGGVLPSCLVNLEINSCGVRDKLLSRYLQNLASLSALDIKYCPYIKSLPSPQMLCHLTSLRQLHIQDCEELTSLSGLHALISLKELKVSFCPKLLMSVVLENEDGGNLLPSSLHTLEINSCGVTDTTLPRCLQNLTSLSTLEIRYCPHITSLGSAKVLCNLTTLQELYVRDCQSLQSLVGLGALNSLQRLVIMHCPAIRSLPEDGLPASLEYLSVMGCSPMLKEQSEVLKEQLEDQLHEKEGPERDNIVHIPYMQIYG